MNHIEETNCNHQKASNKEIDFVIQQIMDKTYLFEPPCGTYKGRKYISGHSALFDVNQQKSISTSAHSHSPVRTLVPCQRCAKGRGGIYVYLNRVYKRMVKKGIIEEYPEVEKVANMSSFGERYLKLESDKN